MNLSVDKMINFNKVKFSTLESLFRDIKFKEDQDHINIFINVASLTNWFYNAKVRSEIINFDNNVRYRLLTNLISMALHYRLYFYHYKQISSSIYFYYSDKSSMDNRILINDYNMVYAKKREPNNQNFLNISNYINSELNLFNEVVKYIHDVFYIYGDSYEYSLIPPMLVLSNKNKDDFNLFITKDKYEYQNVNLRNSFILHPKKEESKLIEPYNLIEILNSDTKFNSDNYYSSKIINHILSIKGIDSRNIKGIRGIGVVKILKQIDIMVKSYNKIPNINTFADLFNISQSEKNKILNNYNVIDYKSQLYRINRSILMTKIITSLQNIRNDKDLFKFNNDYCNGEINLDVIYKGVR